MIAFCSCTNLFTPKFVDEEIKQSDLFIKNHPTAYSTISDDKRDLAYTHIGNKSGPKIIFVHGSPGNWGAFVNLLNRGSLQSVANLYSVDRLGYGGSRRGGVSRSLDEQARYIMKLLDTDNPEQPAIVVGHSYGGPVVAKIAAQNDSRVRSVVILAGSVAPEYEETKWFQIPADWLIFSWLIPNDLLTCNKEILALKPELEELKNEWSHMTAKITVVQGGKDDLVDPRNADFIEKNAQHLTPKIIRLENQNHFLQANENDLVEKILLEEVRKL